MSKHPEDLAWRGVPDPGVPAEGARRRGGGSGGGGAVGGIGTRHIHAYKIKVVLTRTNMAIYLYMVSWDRNKREVALVRCLL